MAECFIFWAQALDNHSPDHFEEGGKEIPPDGPDAPSRRRTVVSMVSDVIKSGSGVFKSGGVQLTEMGRRLVLEVPSAELDSAGRSAPIICCAEYDEPLNEAFCESAVKNLANFAKRIHRTINFEHSELQRQAFKELRKRIEDRKYLKSDPSLLGKAKRLFSSFASSRGTCDESVRRTTDIQDSPSEAGLPADTSETSPSASLAGPFPSDPARRRVIFAFQSHDIERCKYEKGAAKLLLAREVYLLQVPVRADGEIVSEALQQIVERRLATAGSILIQSPYDPDAYEEASLAPRAFALEKHLHFSRLCLYLGAKEVEVKQVDVRRNSTKNVFQQKVDAFRSGGQFEIDKEEREKFSQQMQLRDVFAGGTPDTRAAEKLLRQTGLWSDLTMRSLLEMRRGGTNQLMERKLVLSLSSESKNNLDVVGRLNLKNLPFLKFSTNFDVAITTQLDYSVTVQVRF